VTLVVEGLSKAIGGLRILDGVSLAVPADGMIGLIGPNGAGKSSLFAVISGFMAADAGAMSFGGAALDARSPQARSRLGLLRTFQVPRPFSHLTVRENLMVAAPDQKGQTLRGALFGGAAVRREREAIRARAAEIIEFLNLAAVADAPARQLSGGQRKLLELGRVLMAKPRMILLDEPFAGVNPVLFGQIGERLQALNATGIGFFIIEHNLQALARLVRRLHVMDRGRLLAEGAPDEVLRDPAVREAYIGGVG
jgi:branched-chain amino acid transport system ATP-binding protein